MLKGTYFVIDDGATAAEDDDLNALLESFVKEARGLVKAGEPVAGNGQVREDMTRIVRRWGERAVYVDGLRIGFLDARMLEHILFSEL